MIDENLYFSEVRRREEAEKKLRDIVLGLYHLTHCKFHDSDTVFDLKTEMREILESVTEEQLDAKS